jgi:5'-3' exonuclease
MARSAQRHLLLDSASLYYRAFYGVPDTITAPDGSPINAVRGFVDMLTYLITSHRPHQLVACWDDDWRPAFRVNAIASYKTQRLDAAGVGEDTPPQLGPQVPIIAELLAAIGIPKVGCPGFEADDVLATLAERAAAAGDCVDIVTGDRDLFQLVDDERAIRVIYTAQGGVRNPDIVDQARLRERYDIADGPQYAALAVLRGDPSDGLPGVAGIGDKTGAALLAQYGTLDAMLTALDADGPGFTTAQRNRLHAGRDYLRVAPTVVNVVRDVPLPIIHGDLPTSPADPTALAALSERWGLTSTLARLAQALRS